MQWLQGFEYDELGRLKNVAEYQGGSMSSQTYSQSYTFDRYGNRFQSANSTLGLIGVSSSEIDASTNRFITSGSTPVTYDAAGNITQDKKFRWMNYSYDANGRMISAARIDEVNSQTSVYDCAGQRVRTSGNGVTRTMVYDVFGQLVADYTGSNGATLERENIYRGGQLLAVYEAGGSCYKSIGDFVTAFYQGVLQRSPNSTELSNWTTTLTQGQAQGQSQLIAAAQNLGSTLFNSSEYASLSTSNAQYVSDLYHGFLQRAPDTDGYNYWLGILNSENDRGHLLRAFQICEEFANNVAALCVSTSSTSASIKYVLTDVQGTTRAVMNNNGSSSAVVSRHDFLPFGEEIWAGIGSRSTSQAYAATNAIRQKYGLTERDDATGLDHTWWRKYESFSGRWTSPDPYNGSMAIADPQSFHRYAYVQNDPVNFIDPTGADPDTIAWFFWWLLNSGQWTVNVYGSFAGGIFGGGGGGSGGHAMLMEIGEIEPGGAGVGGIGPSSISSPPQQRGTVCPPVQFTVTGIAPGQAPGTTAITRTARADIPNGGVAIKPQNFGVRGINRSNRSVFQNISFTVDWSTANPASTPAGIPTEGPFFAVDVVGPASVRNAPGNMIDVYNYTSRRDALASTRTVMVTTIIPVNSVGVTCPR